MEALPKTLSCYLQRKPGLTFFRMQSCWKPFLSMSAPGCIRPQMLEAVRRVLRVAADVLI